MKEKKELSWRFTTAQPRIVVSLISNEILKEENVKLRNNLQTNNVRFNDSSVVSKQIPCVRFCFVLFFVCFVCLCLFVCLIFVCCKHMLNSKVTKSICKIDLEPSCLTLACN